MTIVVADKLEPDVLKELAQFELPIVDLSAKKGDEKEAHLRHALPEAQVLIVRSATTVTAEHLAVSPNLRVIARFGAGLDNIDPVLPICKERNIEVINTPEGHRINVPEHAFALMLSLAKGIVPANAAMHNGDWPKGQFKPIELAGKTLGILAFGRIGRQLGSLAAALDMKVIFYDAFPIQTQVAEQVSLEELFARSDVISVHLPKIPETVNLLNADAFAQMKKGVIIINTARGHIIDEIALVNALREGQVGAAGLDVFVNEPYGKGPLTGLPNVILTPHLSSETPEAKVRLKDELMAKLRAILPIQGLAATFTLTQRGANGAAHVQRAVTGGRP